MENQTRFDLNAAVESWRQELAAQSGLTADNRRELETHLQEAITRLKGTGLSDEESYLLARHRIGHPHLLTDEFIKSNPAQVWRERIFWMALAILTLRLWGVFISFFLGIIPIPGGSGRFTITIMTIQEIVYNVPLIWLAISLVLGRVTGKNILWKYLSSSPLFVLVTVSVLFFTLIFLPMIIQISHMSNYTFLYPNILFNAEKLITPSLLIALIVWLKPPKRKSV